MSNVLEKYTREPDGWRWGHFENGRGQMLRYGALAEYKKPHAHIVYVEGLSEFAEKTFELSQDLSQENCNFYVLDRYGQGCSGRLLRNQFKQHSTGFKDDITDLVQLTHDIIAPKDNTPVILLGHSTGGLISLMALQEETDTFDGAIMTAPLFGIHHPVIKGREKLFAKLPNIKILLELYIPGGRDWSSRTSPDSELKPDDFSSDPIRNIIQDYHETRIPAIRTGSPTIGWIKNACSAISTVRNPDYLQTITKPVLIFTAGNDKLVHTTPSFNINANLPKSQLTHFEKGKHELLMESDSIRKPLLEKSFDFIENTSFRKP